MRRQGIAGHSLSSPRPVSPWHGHDRMVAFVEGTPDLDARLAGVLRPFFAGPRCATGKRPSAWSAPSAPRLYGTRPSFDAISDRP